MAERRINPVVKMGLELGPVLAFFIAYGRMKDATYTLGGTSYSGFIVVTAAFIALMVVTTGLLWALTGRLSRMQLATLVLVVGMGGLSVWLNDERFFKVKPTILYAVFAGILFAGLVRGTSYLRLLMEELVPLRPEGWMILTWRFAWLFVALAVANEAVWRLMSTDAWVNFKTFGVVGAMFAFFMAQGRLFERYAVEQPEADDAASADTGTADTGTGTGGPQGRA